jgi:ABC-2 type transport system permease protein
MLKQIKQDIYLFWRVLKNTALRFKTYPMESASVLLGSVLEVGLPVIFWMSISKFSSGPKIDLKDIVSYYLIASGLILILYTNFSLGAESNRAIKSGDLSQNLIKPLNPLLGIFAERVGRDALTIITSLVMVLVGFSLNNTLTITKVPLLVLVLINAALINLGLNILTGSIAFYSAESGNIKSAFLHVARLLRGTLIPLTLISTKLYGILQLTPFPGSLDHLVRGIKGQPIPAKFLIISSIWAVLILVGSNKLYKHSLKRYEGVGI